MTASIPSTTRARRGESRVSGGVGGVGGHVVVGVAEGGGVGDHDRGVVLLPEGPVVGPTDAGDAGGEGGAFGGEERGGAELGDGAAGEAARGDVADEGNEVAG